jgi:Spy/CpxP family protein refolding chaperone
LRRNNDVNGEGGRVHLKVKIAAIVTALAALVVLAGFAPTHSMEGHGPMMGGGMMRGGMMGRPGTPPMAMFFKAANLTPDQQTKVRKIFEDNRATFKDLSEQMRTAREGMVDKLLAPGQVSDVDLTKQSQEVAQIQQKMMEQHLKVALAVRAVMTPEQLQKVQKVVQLHRQMQDLHRQMRDLFQGSSPASPTPPPSEG